MPHSEIMNPKQAAEFLGTSASTLAVWRRTGQGPRFIRYGPKAIRYRVSDLKDWVEAQPSFSSIEQMRAEQSQTEPLLKSFHPDAGWMQDAETKSSRR